MDKKKSIDDLLTNENYADNLSDISDACYLWEKFDDFDEEHDSESLKTLDSDMEDEDDPLIWDDKDPPRNNEPFLGTPGPTFDIADSLEMIIEKFIDDEFFKLVTEETNKYYSQNSNKYKSVENSEWVDVTVPEMKRWFGLVLNMSAVRKSELANYWTTDPLLETPHFPRTMSKKRFFDILQFLHFSDNSNAPANASRFHKVQKITDYFTEKFQQLYKPSQNLSMVESFIPWRRFSYFKSFKPENVNRYGLFLRRVHDSETGYLLNINISEDVPLPLQTAVKTLIGPELGKWHNLYMENFYFHNNLKIAKSLLPEKVRMCAVVDPGRKLLHCLGKGKLETFESKFKRMGEVLVHKWKDCSGETTSTISTIHNAECLNAKKKSQKITREKEPVSLTDHKKYMKKVYTAHKHVSINPLYKKTKKWSKKVVLYLMYHALFNAYAMSQIKNPNPKYEYYNFALDVVKVWFDKVKNHRKPETESDSEYSSYDSDFNEYEEPKEDSSSALGCFIN